jgi:hypothetical protein
MLDESCVLCNVVPSEVMYAQEAELLGFEF